MVRPSPAEAFPLNTGLLLQRKCACGTHTIGGGECEGCGKARLQRKASNRSDPPEVPSVVHDALRSPGQPLDAATRAFMEPRFGHDFSRVRIHTDAQANESARAVNALAYTVGSDIAFAGGAYAPRTQRGRHLLAHELTHVIRQGEGADTFQNKLSIGAADSDYEREADAVADAVTGAGVASFAPPLPGAHVLPGLLQRREDAPVAGTQAPEYAGPDWSAAGKLGIVRVEEADAKVSGANLRKGASTSAELIQHLDENTRVHILSENKATKWLYVMVTSMQYAGAVGYVASHLVWTGLPDPDAVLYYIAEPGLGLQKLVENHPQYKDYDIRTGDDARSIVMAVLAANEEDTRTSGGVRLNEEKLAEASNTGTWEGLKDKADEYRRVLRPILQSVELVKDKKIWLPGKTYIQALKGKGIIPTRAGWKNTAIAIAKGVGGFAAGLGEGFIMSIADVFIGIYEMIKSVVSLIRDLVSGEALKAAEEFYDALVEMIETKTVGEIFTMLKDALVQMVTSSVNDFTNKWNSNNTYNRWNFRGYVVGYILAEIVMIIFTAGTATVAKWLGKLGKLGAKILKVLAKVFDKVDDVLDKVPGRKGRKKHKGDSDQEQKDPKQKKDEEGEEKARELPQALILATSIAETHDARNDPTAVALLSLSGLKRRYKWIKGFSKKKTGPGKFKLIMHASTHVVDDDYTPQKDEEEDISQQVQEEFEDAQKKQTPTDKPEGTSKIVKAKTSMDKLIHDYGVAGGKSRAVKDGLSPNIPGKGKAWENPYEFDGPFGKGIDDIMFDNKGNPVIIEYKGGKAKLAEGQMSRSWICRKIAQLARRNDPMAAILADAIKKGKLSGRLYRTPVSHSGKAGDLLVVEEASLEDTWSRADYKGKCP